MYQFLYFDEEMEIGADRDLGLFAWGLIVGLLFRMKFKEVIIAKFSEIAL